MAKSMKKKGASPSSAGGGKQTAKSKKPQRQGTPFDIDPAAEATSTNFFEPVPLLKNSSVEASPEVLTRLWTIIESRKGADPETSHSARLLARGRARVAQKLGEEAVECLIEVMTGNRAGLIGESADLLYHLLVVWVHAGIQPEEVWQELQQRERISDLAERADVPLERLLGSLQAGTSKIP